MDENPVERGLYAVAKSLEDISNSIGTLSEAVQRLGTSDADTRMGGLEVLAKSIGDSAETIATALSSQEWPI